MKTAEQKALDKFPQQLDDIQREMMNNHKRSIWCDGYRTAKQDFCRDYPGQIDVSKLMFENERLQFKVNQHVEDLDACHKIIEHYENEKRQNFEVYKFYEETRQAIFHSRLFARKVMNKKIQTNEDLNLRIEAFMLILNHNINLAVKLSLNG